MGGGCKLKGIILAGGSGTRLYPVTQVVSKQLLPIYDKPMIYYPISTLMLAGIKDILVISTPEDIGNFQKLLGDGKRFGVSFSYAVQEVPNGLAQAFVIGEEFIGSDSVCLILGDNVFYGNSFTEILRRAVENTETKKCATVFGKYVNDPERFGVVEFDSNGKAISVEEKPANPRSNYAIVGLYFYDNSVIDIAKNIKPSARGEYEITEVNRYYLDQKKLSVVKMGRGIAWLDSGTMESMLLSDEFVRSLYLTQGIRISVPEEIGFINGWITEEKLQESIEMYKNSPYGDYLKLVLKRGKNA